MGCKGGRELSGSSCTSRWLSVLPLGTRGPFEGRQEVPGRLTSCLLSFSQARGREGLVQPN